MSTTCILEQIAQKLVTSLTALKTAGKAADVIRPTCEGLPKGLADKTLILFQGDPQEANDEAGMDGWKSWIQPFQIACVIRPAKANLSASVDAQTNDMKAIIEQQLLSDTSLGGLATDTVIRPSTGFVETNGAFWGVSINIDVYYRTLYGNPYSQ